MTLTNDPYMKLTGSDYFVFSQILNGVNKSTLGKQWKVESEALLTLTKDPVMESQDLTFIVDRTVLLH
ncbi:hypothetical protein ILUMI_11697 [Ignelater luminosus]|uniref:Uncharacterized protein n=1 Tax=Ignelater luminosus TaxID=2038154 RepID=A0A8K0D019_IGNLU|nr:hypothetical protein ILUMI_11697 [Ignelater luminosus]